MPPLYVTDEGQAVVTNSMLQTFLKCHKQAEYKYAMRLKPRLLGKPLSRGVWVHELLEVNGKGGDWKERHRLLSAKFNDMFEEERDYYGDLPREIYHIMTSYFWHYKNDPWKYLESEITLECDLPDGTLFRCKIDNLIENQFGLWLVDHKTHKSLPGLAYRMLDTQAPRYIYAALANKIPVNGFIWNYLRWKAPTIPKLLKDGSRLSKSAVDTDWPTFARAIKRHGLDPEDYRERLDYYKSLRYEPGHAQTSPFFQRIIMEKQGDLLARVEKATLRTAENMNNYDFSDPDGVERNTGRHCEFACSFTDICSLELLNGRPAIRNLLKQNYTQGDPLDYYQDKAGEVPGKDAS